MVFTGGLFDFAVVFTGGVLVSFTPCVYPILPVLAAAVAGANLSRSRFAGFFLSLMYVAGVALSYSLLAVLAALTGQVFGRLQNSFWLLFVTANALLVFALAMFDLFSLPVPVPIGPLARGRGLFSLFVMGLLSGLMVGPCTSPVLGALLISIAAKTNFWHGVSLVVTFSLGLGASLILAGTFSGFLAGLPKSGAWMMRIKKGIGLMLLGMAEFYFLKAGRVLQ